MTPTQEQLFKTLYEQKHRSGASACRLCDVLLAKKQTARRVSGPSGACVKDARRQRLDKRYFKLAKRSLPAKAASDCG
jgi:hypothetical protein